MTTSGLTPPTVRGNLGVLSVQDLLTSEHILTYPTVYRSTALVLWPAYNHTEMTITPERLESILEQLESGEGDSVDVELILGASGSQSINHATALRALCSISSSRKDFDLWRRAILAFDGDKNISTLEMKGILQAIVAFGHSAVRS